ncbi:hypothetical protein ACHAXM_001049 [Skeletonema potamos]
MFDIHCVKASTLAYSGNSSGAVFLILITLPAASGVSTIAKNGRSNPSSVYSSTTCLLLFGPCNNSILAFKGRPSVLMITATDCTIGAKGQVRTAPP